MPQGPQELLLWTGQRAPVRPAGLVAAGTTLEWQLPESASDVGWHTDSDDCGHGVTVIGGHVSWGIDGVLRPLLSTGLDDRVACTDAQGETHTFAPVDYYLVQHRSDSNPQDWTPAWRPALLLYTCLPDYEGQIVVRLQEVN
jgi:hypothetical protein